MNHLYGIQRLAEDMARDFHDEILGMDQCAWGTDSPIEHLFYMALSAWAVRPWARHKFQQIGLARGSLPERLECNILYVQTQVALIGDWPVDFVLRLQGDRYVCFVVECDGHEFHERTKEQAARDRSRDRQLQANGIPILRFTGSEIYRDPVRCARETYGMLEERAYTREVQP